MNDTHEATRCLLCGKRPGERVGPYQPEDGFCRKCILGVHRASRGERTAWIIAVIVFVVIAATGLIRRLA